jgi:hypothetical protein
MMDPNLARMLIHFDRPGGPNELTPADRAALEETLRAHPELASLTNRQGAEDRAMTSALRSVPVPPSARANTLEKLLARRSALVWRQRILGGALAATIVCGVGLSLGLTHRFRPSLDAYELAIHNERFIEAPQENVRLWLEHNRLPTMMPVDMDFTHYLEHGTQNIRGVDVPVVTFVAKNANARLDFAKVYLVSNSQFQLQDLTDAQSSLTMATVHRDPRHPGYAWVIIHTTPTLEPFLKAPKVVTRA